MKLQEIKIGLELETVQRERGTVARAIQSVVGGEVTHAGGGTYDAWEVRDRLDRVWRVVADSSLTSVPSNLRAEVVSPILGYDDIPELQEVVRAVKKCGAQVDEKCGLHVHVSHPDVTAKALANLAKLVYKQQDIIYAALGVNQQRMAQYCKPISPWCSVPSSQCLRYISQANLSISLAQTHRFIKAHVRTVSTICIRNGRPSWTSRHCTTPSPSLRNCRSMSATWGLSW